MAKHNNNAAAALSELFATRIQQQQQQQQQPMPQMQQQTQQLTPQHTAPQPLPRQTQSISVNGQMINPQQQGVGLPQPPNFAQQRPNLGPGNVGNVGMSPNLAGPSQQRVPSDAGSFGNLGQLGGMPIDQKQFEAVRRLQPFFIPIECRVPVLTNRSCSR